MNSCPLVVDLDGTLVRTDMLHESALVVLHDDPLSLLQAPRWLARGKAVLKQELARRSAFDPAGLPYDHAFLAWLHAQRALQRRLVLCTASDRQIAARIAAHLGLFDEVIASDGVNNLAGAAKARVLVERYGEKGFDYAGNSAADLAVWPHARRAVLVNAPAAVVATARQRFEVEQAFPPSAPGLKDWLRVLRLHQWLKNLLLLAPLLASHRVTEIGLWLTVMVAMLAFSLCASAVYVANDLLDLDSDRQHLRKRSRPFAAGRVPIWQGVVLMPLLLLGSAAVSWAVGPGFAACVAGYFILTCAYTMRLKRLLLLDCTTLALLYTLRIVAGAQALHLELTFWLLAFSFFLFLSLAFVKRYAELGAQQQQGLLDAPGRAYRVADAPLVQTFGVTAGQASALVLALYLNSDAVRALYVAPAVVWAAVPVLLFWISWMWIQAHRGLMHDDPVVYALKDRVSLAAGAAFALVIVIGGVGWPW